MDPVRKIAAFLPITAEQLDDTPRVFQFVADRILDAPQRLDSPADDEDSPPESSGDET